MRTGDPNPQYEVAYYRFESCPDYKAKGPHLPAIGV